MNSSIRLQEVVDAAAALGDVSPALATGGLSDAPALSIANDVIQAIINGGPAAQPYNWKWNRFNVSPFCTNSYQQDYFVPGVVSLGWLESCWATNINQTSIPKQKQQVEVHKDLDVTYDQTGYPGKICWLPNSMLQTGTWGAVPLGPTAGNLSGDVGGLGPNASGLQNPGPGVVYTNPLGAVTQPINATTAIKDPFGNLWALTTYGTCGTTEPNWNGTYTVTVLGTTMPWDPTLASNSAYPFANGPAGTLGTKSIVIPMNGKSSITISAVGAISAGATFPDYGPIGGDYQLDYFPGSSTSGGGVFPISYLAGSSGTGPIQLIGLMGAFTDSTGKVLQIVAIGNGGTFTVPQGAYQLQLGVNDNIYNENVGSFTVTIGAPQGIVYPTVQNPTAVATTVTDGTCVWTAINPSGQGFRLSPIPPQSGVVWQIRPVAQYKAPRFKNLGQTLEPIPDDFEWAFKQGFFAECYRRNPDPKVRGKYPMERQIWLESLDKAVRQADREMDDFGFVPTRSIMDSGQWGSYGPRPDYPWNV